MMSMWMDIGLFSATLLWVALCIKLTRRWLPPKALWAVAAIALLLGMVPFDNLVIGSYMFALTSWLSVPTLALLLLMLAVSCCGERCTRLKNAWNSNCQWLPVFMFSIVAGVLLYPMAGGLTMFDPYRLGFAGTPLSFSLPLYLLCWSLVCVLYRWYLLLGLILAAVLAYYLKLLPSPNLWDYVMDPLLVLYSLFMIVKLSLCKVFKSRPSN